MQGLGMVPAVTDYVSLSQPPRVPRPPAQSVLVSQATARTVSQLVAGVKPQDVSKSCVVCQESHPESSCVDMDSVMSLRLAVDMLRTSRADPHVVQGLRQRFQQRIRELAGPK